MTYIYVHVCQNHNHFAACSYLKEDILKVTSWPGVGVDTTDEDIVICVEISVLGLKLLHHLRQGERRKPSSRDWTEICKT